jgi:(E)-4-hydroxy-3-methylbut-2-enyl-diphosphate synthase
MRRLSEAVDVAGVTIGGGAPVVVQSMTDTDTADAAGTVRQCIELATSGTELIRITVDRPEAAAAVPEIRRRLDGLGCGVPLIGDFHYNGHLLLRDHPECAPALAKLRINPGNVGAGARRDDNFDSICRIARDHGKPIRIGVNAGSLDRSLVTARMQENADRGLGMTANEVLDACAIDSALLSTDRALACGLGVSQIVVSCKISEPRRLISVYRRLAAETSQPLHLGLTEAGLGVRGVVWSVAAMSVLLADGIGDTIRMSLTPRPGGSRCDEVHACWELLQALGLRSYAPTVVACPGCGRTSGTGFRELADTVQAHVQAQLPSWRDRYPGVENMTLAVMGCIVNGPGESRTADIGISLPGAGEEPRCPVFVDGVRVATLKGGPEDVARAFIELVDRYVSSRFQRASSGPDGSR